MRYIGFGHRFFAKGRELDTIVCGILFSSVSCRLFVGRNRLQAATFIVYHARWRVKLRLIFCR
jgi:hypothetical protein